MVTTWQDHRVTVAQLSENHNDNILPDEELWYPAIVMPNSVFDDRMEILQHQGTHIAFTAKKTGTGLATARDGYEGVALCCTAVFLFIFLYESPVIIHAISKRFLSVHVSYSIDHILLLDIIQTDLVLGLNL